METGLQEEPAAPHDDPGGLEILEESQGLGRNGCEPPPLPMGSWVPPQLCILNSHLSSGPISNTSVFQHYTILFNKLSPGC